MKYYLNLLDGGEYAMYIDAAHGSRMLQVPDPAYVRRKLDDGTDDPADMPPLVDSKERNPDTAIPPEAVEISEAEYRELAGASDKLVSVSGGKIVISKRPPRELTTQEKRAQINVERDAATTAPVSAIGQLWDADSKSRETIMAVLVAAGAGVPLPADLKWTTFDDKDVPVTIADLGQIAAAMLEQGNAAHAAARIKKAAL